MTVMSMNHETLLLRPGDLRPGDVIYSPGSGRSIEVDEINPIMIPYWDQMVPVFWIKGIDHNMSGKVIYKVQTVCLPRTPWYVLSRRPVAA